MLITPFSLFQPVHVFFLIKFYHAVKSPSTCPASSLVTFCSIWFYYTEKNLPDTSAKPIVFKWVSGRFSFLTCLVNNLQKSMVCSSFQSIESPRAESSRSMWGLGKGVSGEPYPRLCNTRRPWLESGTFRSQAVRLYRLHQARPSL